MFAITPEPIDPRALEAAVSWPGAGAVLTFSGITRDTFGERQVLRLEYEAYAELAVPVMEAIGREVSESWPGVRLAMVHRTGVVEVGEASVVIAVASPHRAAAYEASRYAIDALKGRVPVWKKERYTDGSAWKENPEFAGAVEALGGSGGGGS